MKKLIIEFNDRNEGRRFLKIARKNPLFKKHFSKWDKRSIYFTFSNEEQGKIVSEIIINVLNELEIKFKEYEK